MALFGIYGSHTVAECPIHHAESGKRLAEFAESDPTPTLEKYKIRAIVGQYHSALEHTFIWILDAEDAHLVEEFAIASGLAAFNALRIVPLKTLAEGVLPKIKAAHGL